MESTPTKPSAVSTFLLVFAVLALLALPIPVLIEFGADALPRLGLAAGLVLVPGLVLFVAQRRAGGPSLDAHHRGS